MTIVEHPPVEIPTFNSLSDTEKQSLLRINELYLQLPSSVATILEYVSANEDKFKASWSCHELSSYYMQANEPRVYRNKTTSNERSVASIAIEAAKPIENMTVVNFKKVIRVVLSTLNAGRLRKGYVYTVKDLNGSSVRYPPPHSLRLLLEPLRQLIVHSSDCPAYAAVVAYVVISGAHPLTDGNGRLSRIIFNAIMMYNFRGVGYLPLYEISMLSGGSHILGCREAHYYGEWENIISFFERIVGDLVYPFG